MHCHRCKSHAQLLEEQYWRKATGEYLTQLNVRVCVWEEANNLNASFPTAMRKPNRMICTTYTALMGWFNVAEHGVLAFALYSQYKFTGKLCNEEGAVHTCPPQHE